MANASHRAGGGDVRIENRKLDWKREGRTDALNSSYKPGGGDKRVIILHNMWIIQLYNYGVSLCAHVTIRFN